MIKCSVISYMLLAIGMTEAFMVSPGMVNTRNLRLSSMSDTNSEDKERLLAANQSRKQFISSAVAFTMLSTCTLAPKSPANAAYGDSTTIALPNYIEFLIEKNTMIDKSKVLYKGADIEVQIKRISEAATRLNEIPLKAKEKKWSQVQGILTGPLGTLVQTMNSLCKDTDSGEAKKAAAKVKGDIILISQEAGRKNENGVVKACEDAQHDLEVFAKLVF